MNCYKCFELLKEEVLSGCNEPLEKLYTCPRCGREILSVEGLGDEILKDGGENGK